MGWDDDRTIESDKITWVRGDTPVLDLRSPQKKALFAAAPSRLLRYGSLFCSLYLRSQSIATKLSRPSIESESPSFSGLLMATPYVFSLTFRRAKLMAPRIPF
jgi:hypothetical protein